MPISKFQQKVLEEAFAQVLDQFKGRTIDPGGELKREVEAELRKKLMEIASHEPVFGGFTVTVSVDQLQTDRFVFDVHRTDLPSETSPKGLAGARRFQS